VVLVVAALSGGVGAHVRSLAAGLSARGVVVTVCGPAGTDELLGLAGTGARFHPVEITPSPRPRTDAAAVGELRRAFTGASVVHAHGLRAALLSDLALRTAGRVPGLREGTPPLVVTFHHALLATGMERRLLRLMERRVARSADLVLGASSDLVTRARELGAVDARLGPVAAPRRRPAEAAGAETRADASAAGPAGPAGSAGSAAEDAPLRDREEVRAELLAPPRRGKRWGAGRAAGAGGANGGVDLDRPIVLAIGRLVPHKGYHLLLDAARGWRDLERPPLVVIAGGGPQAAELRARIDTEGLPVRLLGHRDDVPDLLAAADLVVLPSRWEARSLVAQEALAAGVPLVATAVGGVPELVGDAAELVPPGNPEALSAAVAGLLGEAGAARRAELAAAGPAQAATWPDEDDAVLLVLSVYDELATSR